ncbi:MAG: FAD-dependent oxidoreductase [Polyangiaceae bacterium]|nr:FAD-dependent oxidoreductase [Polyangiaceae bacterium]
MSSAARPASGPRTSALLAPGGGTAHLLGNEAIVRGALEAGVAFVAGYPGTPSSEVTDGFAGVAQAVGLGFEYAVNEKIALELAFAASLAGARSLCAMKHLGLMVAGDPLSTIPYIGVEAGMVIVSAGDPSCHTSPNEADQRHLGPMLHLPVLDPDTPASAHAMTRAAFELSEAARLPVLLRTTTRVAHSRAEIPLGPLVSPSARGFRRDPARYVPVPAHARRMRLEVEERLRAAREWVARSGLLRFEGSGADVVLASGAPAATTADVLRRVGASDRVALWRLGAVHPLPEELLLERLRGVRRVLVVEELSPFLENALLVLVGRHRLDVEVLGKHSGHLPVPFEYDPGIIGRGLHAAFGVGRAPAPQRALPVVTPRAPSLCPGCPHRSAFVAARAAFEEDQLFFSDIGCYTLGYAPPLRTADALLCMGAGFTLAAGVAAVTGQRTVGFMGDSTFFHAGMPALLDAVQTRANVVAVLLDNGVTAMTGFQESPDGGRMEGVARALGVEHVETVDPQDQAAAIAAFRRARDAEGPSVVVLRRPCPVHATRAGLREKVPSWVAEPDRCRTCGREPEGLRCEVPLTEGFERNLARVASLRAELEPRPEIAPCAVRCPLTLCVQGYAGHLAAGEHAEALAHVVVRTPLPASVCRVCHRPCEDSCVRAAIDEPVAINVLKKHVVDWAERERPELLVPPCESPHGRRVAVVGAGVSGLSAARELVVRGYAVTLYDAETTAGGMLRHAIPEHRLAADAADRDVGRILGLGVEFVGATRLGREVSLAELRARHDAVYVAIGAWRPRRLTLPGEGPRVVSALPYLRSVRHGEPAPEADTVVVLGGGNAALDAARTAHHAGGRRVVVACLEAEGAMPALRDELEAARADGVAFENGVRPVALTRDGVRVRPVQGGAERTLPCALVIVAIGQEVDAEAFAAGEDAPALDEQGRVRVDPETAATSLSGVFAGGDVVAGERTVTHAIAWGLRAAWGIDRLLRGREIADRRPPPLRPRPAPPPARASAPRAPRAPADARAEARRCLMCGQCGNCRACIEVLGCPAIGMSAEGDHVRVDPAWCIGCGVCAQVCSNGAFHALGVA